MLRSTPEGTETECSVTSLSLKLKQGTEPGASGSLAGVLGKGHLMEDSSCVCPCTCVCIHVFVSTCASVYMCIYVSVCPSVYVFVCVCPCVYPSDVFMCMCIHLCVYPSVCICVYVCVPMCGIYVFVHMYMCIHTLISTNHLTKTPQGDPAPGHWLQPLSSEDSHYPTS